MSSCRRGRSPSSYDRGRSKCHDPWGCSPSPQGAFGLGLVLRKDVMLRLYHAFLGLRNRPQPLTGKGCLLCKTKNPHRTADGTLRVRISSAGGFSPHCRASRGRMCGARGHLAHRTDSPPNLKPLLTQRGGRVAACAYLRGFLGCIGFGPSQLGPYAGHVRFPSDEPCMCVRFPSGEPCRSGCRRG